MRIVFFPEAKQDLLRIRKTIRDDLHNPDAAARILKKLTDDIALLKTSPGLGVSYEARTGIRRDARILISGHYWIVYRAEREIVIMQVVDTRQDYMRVLGSYPGR